MFLSAAADGGIQPPIPNPRGAVTPTSLDEAVHLVGQAICPHRLRTKEPAKKELSFLSSLDLGSCGLVSLQYGFDVDIDAGYIDDSYLVKWTLAGEGRVSCGEQTAITSPRSIIVTSPTDRTKISMTAQCHHLTVRVSRRALEASIVARLGRPLTKPLQFSLSMSMDSDFARAWCELVRHICHISATAPAAFACEAVRKQYARTLMEIMLNAAPHTYSDDISDDAGQTTPRHVHRARDYIHAHLSENISITDIAASVGVTARTLQNGFRQAFNTTPAEYVRQARVQALHRALLNADSQQGVTSLMMGVGIVNFGRYAHYYRQQMGVTPSMTLRQKK